MKTAARDLQACAVRPASASQLRVRASYAAAAAAASAWGGCAAGMGALSGLPGGFVRYTMKVLRAIFSLAWGAVTWDHCFTCTAQ